MSTPYIYSAGIVHCSVCADAATPVEQLCEQVNAANPTGIDSKWAVSE